MLRSVSFESLTQSDHDKLDPSQPLKQTESNMLNERKSSHIHTDCDESKAEGLTKEVRGLED